MESILSKPIIWKQIYQESKNIIAKNMSSNTIPSYILTPRPELSERV